VNDCAKLGSLYEKRNKNTEALFYFKKACDGGIILICMKAGYVLKGLGKLKAAKSIFHKYCYEKPNETVVAQSCFELGMIEDSEKNKDAANKAFKRAFRDTGQLKVLYGYRCSQGDRMACFKLGMLEERLGKKDRARKYYGEACLMGVMAACQSKNDVFK